MSDEEEHMTDVAESDVEEGGSTEEQKPEPTPYEEMPLHELLGKNVRTRVGSTTGNPERANVIKIGNKQVAVKRGPGRTKLIEKAPTVGDLEYHYKAVKDKQAFIENDPLVKAVTGRADSFEILRQVKEQISKETAALNFQRIENEKRGKDTAQISSRRIDALLKVANIELDMKKLGAESIDLKGEKFQRVFSFLIETMRGVAQSALAPEQVDLLFNLLASAMEGWEEKAAEMVI